MGKYDFLLLTGREVLVIPGLAIVGAASIIGGTVYVGYKTVKAIGNAVSNKKQGTESE